MDSTRFDAFTERVATWTTRRSAVALLSGLGLSWHTSGNTTARKSGKCQSACAECSICKKGKCKKKNGTKRCRKGTCEPLSAGAPCSAPSGGTCQNGTCSCPPGATTCAGACVNTRTDETNCGACGTTCSANQVCQAGTCFPRAGCPTTQVGLCTPASAMCGAPADVCFCAQSTEGNAVCVSLAGNGCTTPICPDTPTCINCTVDADCAAGSVCVDASGVGGCAGCLAGRRLCLPACPNPIPAREVRGQVAEGIRGGLLAP